MNFQARYWPKYLKNMEPNDHSPQLHSSIDPSTPVSRSDVRNKKWRKILYEDSGFPDNHVDGSFLEEMRKNISTPIYSRSRVISEAEVVSRQVSCVSLFVAVFAFLFLEWTSPRLVLGVAGVTSACGFLIYRFTATS